MSIPLQYSECLLGVYTFVTKVTPATPALSGSMAGCEYPEAEFSRSANLSDRAD